MTHVDSENLMKLRHAATYKLQCKPIRPWLHVKLEIAAQGVAQCELSVTRV